MRAITYARPSPESNERDAVTQSLVVSVSKLNMPGHPTVDYLLEQETDGYWAVYGIDGGQRGLRLATVGTLYHALNYIMTHHPEAMHLMKPHGGTQCGAPGEMHADIRFVDCDVCLDQHEALTAEPKDA